MHGRIKVKTTAEQAEEKRREQARKLKLFLKASTVAFKKITEKEYDETGLQVTAEILSRNSDFSSLWNYRKRAIKSIKQETEDGGQKFCEDELEFLTACLRNNPKSYGCWHHRCFIMFNIPTPDWKKELKLCNQFLQFDDRNFHCWDYRRFVVKNSVPKVPIDDEIRVTEHLIENNFSNYSSWHYRSKLLPQRYPSLESYEQIEKGKLLEELEYVQNAFFTDPNDQSAWFYHQWLIGRGEQDQKILAIHCDRQSNSITIISSSPISISLLKSHCTISIENEIKKGKWKPILSNTGKYGHGWSFGFNENIPNDDFSISIDFFGKNTRADVNHDSDFVSKSFFTKGEFRQDLDANKLLVLKSELASCRDLSDLEPDNKWVVLTVLQLMNVIDPEKYKEDINAYVSELQTIDPSRKQYYADLRSKIFVEQAFSVGQLKESFNLSNSSITRFFHVQYFSCVKIIDFSGNNLKSLRGPLYLLRCCEQLLADNNEICDISGVFNVPKLIMLSLKGNCLSDIVQLKTLSTCPCLKSVDIRQNAISDDVDAKNVSTHFDVTI